MSCYGTLPTPCGSAARLELCAISQSGRRPRVRIISVNGKSPAGGRGTTAFTDTDRNCCRGIRPGHTSSNLVVACVSPVGRQLAAQIGRALNHEPSTSRHYTLEVQAVDDSLNTSAIGKSVFQFASPWSRRCWSRVALAGIRLRALNHDRLDCTGRHRLVDHPAAQASLGRAAPTL